MKSTAASDVQTYLAGQPDAVRRVLKRVRTVLRKALPDAEEGISYGMPTYKLGGRPVVYFAGWKSHYALYPGSAHVVETLGDEVKDFVVSKGTIRFELDAPVPVQLITRVALLRAEEVRAALAARRTKVAKKKAPARVLRRVT